MEQEKYSYVEALRWLAAKYNVEIEETETSPEFKQQQQVADSLYIINNFAQKHFSEALFNTEEGQDIALSYLKERGYRDEIINKFQLGYNSEARDGFTKAALAAQYSLDYLQKTGLVNVRDGNAYDNYRGRIIFPIHNQSGKVLGFGARLIKNNDKAPKYINSPENEIYVKSKILYGSYFARQAIDKADECLLVEGYTDVVSLHQAGIENVVASGGTSLTPDQLRLVKKYTNNLTIIYDGDSAGIKAALRGLDLALEESLNVKLVLIPDNEDPDSYVNKVGTAEFINFINANKKDFILFQLGIALKDAGNDSTKKSIVVNQIAETISKINKAEDFTKQQDYIKQCSEILKIEESGLHALVNKFIREKVSKEENRSSREQHFSEENIITETSGDIENDAMALFNKDEIHEQAMIRSLLFSRIQKHERSQASFRCKKQRLQGVPFRLRQSRVIQLPLNLRRGHIRQFHRAAIQAIVHNGSFQQCFTQWILRHSAGGELRIIEHVRPRYSELPGTVVPALLPDIPTSADRLRSYSWHTRLRPRGRRMRSFRTVPAALHGSPEPGASPARSAGPAGQPSTAPAPRNRETAVRCRPEIG